MALHAIDTCAGYGGISLGLKLTGLDVRTVAYVERESHAAATLVARMEDQALDLAPIWDDLWTFPAEEFYGCVDIVTGGIPCQPFSAAGKRAGLTDDRWLWPALWSVVQRSGAPWLFLENVPELRRQGLDAVLADLSESGWAAEWGLLSAAAVGAPHRRERIWVLAHAHGHGREGVGWQPADLRNTRYDTHRCISADVAHAEGHRPQIAVAGGYEQAFAWPPHPGDVDGWRAYSGPQPQVRREPDGVTGRLVRPNGLGDRLHLLGNGVVPQAAAAAFLELLGRF